MQLDQHPGETESNYPRIKAHAYPAKCLCIQASDNIGANRYSYDNAGGNQQNDVLTFGYKQAEMEINDGGDARLSNPDQSETGAKLIFDQALIVEQDRQGGA